MKTQPLSILAGLLLTAGIASAATSTIDPTAKYAYSENAGWINFTSTDAGATVTRTALSGYAWCEAAGWVKLGSVAGPYANTNANDWGVNVAYSANVPGGGACSGYAWSENSGWINFAPKDGGVSIGADGKFDGYAWSETLGFIHFDNTSAVSVKTLPLNSPPSMGSQPAVAPSNQVNIGQTATFTASATDPDGDAIAYTWNFGDGSNGSGASVTHTYSTPGNYTVTVTVSDGQAIVTGTLSVVVLKESDQLFAHGYLHTQTGKPDKMTVLAIVPLDSAQLRPTGNTLTVTVGGLIQNFALEAPNSRLKVTHFKRLGQPQIRVLLSLNGTLKDEIYAGQTLDTTGNPTALRIRLQFNGISFSKLYSTKFTRSPQSENAKFGDGLTKKIP